VTAGLSECAGVDVVALATAGVDASFMKYLTCKINGTYSLYR
jgi:hypothetical protein